LEAQAGAAGAGVVAGLAEALKDTFRRDREARLAEMGDVITEGIPAERVAQALLDSSRLRSLFIDAVQSALATDWHAKRILLGRAVARAVLDDARIDVEQMLVRTAQAVEPAHARVLDLQRTPPTRSPEDKERMADSWHKDEITDRLQLEPDVIDALIAPLLSTAAAEDAGIGTYGGLRGVWRLTNWGNHFLDWLRDAEESSKG